MLKLAILKIKINLVDIKFIILNFRNYVINEININVKKYLILN